MTDIAKTAPATVTKPPFSRVWHWLLKPRTKLPPRHNFPRTGQPISQDVVTKLSIRAGFTAGPW